MWKFEHSRVFANIEREKIWRVWADVDNWPKWLATVQLCKLNGNFVAGSSFLLQPPGMRAVTVLLTSVHEGYSFTECTTFFGAKMYYTHTVEDLLDGTIKLTSIIVVNGILQWLWAKLVAQKVADGVPAEMQALVDFARNL